MWDEKPLKTDIRNQPKRMSKPTVNTERVKSREDSKPPNKPAVVQESE